MSRGPSGRIVVELDPALKHELYSALAADGLTFKDWLSGRIEGYLASHGQAILFAAEPQAPAYDFSQTSGSRT